MKNILKWRFKELPSIEKLLELVKGEVITKEEAKQILFSTETEEERDKESLKSEIKFLRDLVERLSANNNTKIVEVIREIKIPYYKQPWYYGYDVWCNTGSVALCNVQGINSTVTNGNSVTNLSNVASTTYTASSFSDIKTF